MKRFKGFTLVELMVTLSLAAIFLTFAVPGYYSIVQNNRVVSMVNNLSAGISFARMESIKRGVKVSLCPAANAALTSCGSISQWGQGWIVFIDADNNNLVDSTTNLVKVTESLPAGSTITANSNILSFDGSGFMTSGTFTMTVSASGCTGNNARILTVSTSGRVSIAKALCN